MSLENSFNKIKRSAGIKKCAPTEKIYPRNNSQIKKKPL